MTSLDKAIMRIPWESDPSLGVRWAMIVITAPIGLGLLILAVALFDCRNDGD